MAANGRLPASALTTVQTGRWAGRDVTIQLARSTATAYFRMAEACLKETGRRTLQIALPAGGYRDYATQAAMRADWYAKRWDRYNLDRTSTVPPAPAGTSNHGLGLCADIWGTGYEWATDNCGRFGFSRPFPATDPHHFQHDGTTTAGGGMTPLLEENDVKIVHTIDTDEYFRAGELTSFKITEAEARDSALIWGQVEIARKNDFMTDAGLANSANDKLIAETVQKTIAALPAGSKAPTKVTIPGPIVGNIS